MVMIPRRSGAGGGRGAVPTLTAGDVPTVRAAADPGVPAVPGAFGGMDGLAEAANQASVTFANIAQKQRTREDTVKRAKAIGSFTTEASDLIRSWETEGDPSDPDSVKPLGEQLAELKNKYIESHDGSDDSKYALQARIEGIYAQLSDTAAIRSTEAQRAKVGKQLAADLSTVYATGGDMETQFKTIDGIIDDYAPAISPEEEIDYRVTARRQIVLNEFNALLKRGDVEGARKLYEEAPQIAAMLSPDTQTQVAGRIASMIQAQEEERNRGRREVEYLRQVLGREPTLAERAMHAGVAAPKGDQTPAQKIAALEDVLGPLSEQQKARALDVAPDAPLTDAGKLVADRENFIAQYGEGSPQVAAFDEAAGSGTVDLSDEAGIRKEFTSLSGDFVKVRDAYKKIVLASKSESGPGDMSMVFNIMKMLDPGSTVREGEYATAKNTTGVPSRIINAYNAAVDGQFLTTEQRTQFVSEASNIMQSQLDSQRQLEKQFSGLAQRKKIDPQDVVLDFVGDMIIEGGTSKDTGKLVLGMDGRPIAGVVAVDAPQMAEAPEVPDAPEPLPTSADQVKDGVWYQGKSGPIMRQNGQWFAPKEGVAKNPATVSEAKDRAKKGK